MLSYIRPSTHRRTSSNTRLAGFRRVRAAPPLSPPSPCEKPHGPMPLALAPPPARLQRPPFSTPPAPAHPLSPPSAGAPSFDSPNVETRRTTSCKKPPPPAPSYTTPPPPLSSETALPIPPPLPSALAPASIPLAHSLTCASLPPPCPQPHITSPTATPTTSFTRFHRSPRRNIPSACHLLAIQASTSYL